MKHGVIAPAFTVALSRVARLRCQNHARTFIMLQPLVYEDLPAFIVVRSEVIVMKGDLCKAILRGHKVYTHHESIIR